MAAVPNRIEALHSSISSLSPQVDIIEVALNGFKEIPQFIKKYNNVNAYLTSNDRGDANKFLHIEKYDNAYYFSCDDDIKYPNDYVSKYIAEIDKNKCLITSHGSNIPPNKIKSYYGDRILKSHFLHDGPRREVHIPGSGVSGFHTSFLKLKYSYFKQPNMADIFLGMQCHLQKIKCITIEHKKGWLANCLSEDQPTIYNSYKKNDKIQTDYINSVSWKKII